MALAMIPSKTAEASSSQSSTLHPVSGLHDSLRHSGPRSLSAEAMPKHPLQTRLEKWDETQDNLRLNLHRQVYGMHMPIRQMMERKLVSHNPHFPGFSGAAVNDVHLDILRGRDESIDMADVLVSAKECQALPMDMHGVMERRLGL